MAVSGMDVRIADTFLKRILHTGRKNWRGTESVIVEYSALSENIITHS